MRKRRGESLRWRVVLADDPNNTRFTTYGETRAEGALMALESLGWVMSTEPMGDAEPAEYYGLDDDDDDDD